MRNGNGTDAAAGAHFGDGFIVQQGDAIPEQISAGRLQKQCALRDGKFRLGADPEKVRCFVFKPVVMIAGEPARCGPFLTGVTNELPFVFAYGAGGRRVCRLVKLRSALYADEVLHPARNTGSLPVWSSRLPACLRASGQDARSTDKPRTAALLLVSNRAGAADVSLDCLWIAGVSDFPRACDGDFQCLANRNLGVRRSGGGDFGGSGLQTAGI
jgi:hypothetical protein